MSTLTFDVLWRDRGASKGMKTLGDTTEKTNKQFTAFGKIAAASALVAGAALIKFGKDSVKAYSEAQQSQAKLQDAFARFPKLADTNIKALQGLNSELAKKTRFDDDATASGQAVLAQFQLTGQEITQLTPLLQDYAAKTGRDLPDAAKVLGKAMLGNGRALKDVGINFKDTGDRGENFNQIMGGLRTQVGGFAEKEGKTAAGQVAILKNQFGELQEAVGEKLMPHLSKAVGLLIDFVGFISENKNVVGPLAAGIAAVAGSIALVVAAAKGVRAVSAAFDTLSISAKGASIAAGGVGIAISAATILIGHYAKKNAEAKAAVDEFTQALQGETDAVQANVRTVAAKQLQDEDALKAAQDLGLSLADVTDAVLGQNGALERIQPLLDGYVAAGVDGSIADQDRATAAGQLSDAIKAVGGAHNKAVGDAKQMEAATKQSTTALSSQEQKAIDAKDALKQWRTEMFKSADAALDLAGSQDAVEAAVDDATASVKDNGKTLDNNTEKGRNNREALRNIASASNAYRQKLIEQGAKQKDVTRATQDGRTAFIRSAEKMGLSTKEAKKLADKYGLLDREINDLNNKTVKTSLTFNASMDKYKITLGRQLGSKAGQAFARGGILPGYQPASGGDDQWAKMRSGEGVYVSEAMRDPYERRRLMAVNKAALAGQPWGQYKHEPATGYAVGGIVNPTFNNPKFPNYSGGANVLRSSITGNLQKLIGDAIKKEFATQGFGGGPAGSAIASGGWASIYAILRRVGARRFTTYAGHDQGASRSRDITPPSNAIAETARRLSSIWYVIYNRRIASVTYGRRWRPYTRSNPHTDHVHVTLRPGVPADRGGLLASGGTASNMSGNLERILSPAQTRDFHNLVKVISSNRGGAVGNTYIVNAPNYVGDKRDLVKALTDLDRQGRLAVVKR